MASWEVTGVQQTQRLGNTGHLEDWINVTFTCADGQGAGSVEVPFTDGWEAAAAAAIGPKAAAIAAFIDSQG